MPKVSVIVPTYNEEAVIDDCLKSLHKQSYKGMEIVVVDDGSKDRTLEVVSKYCVPSEGCGIVRQKHKGAGAARNNGAAHAKGRILVFVDADMIFDRDFVKKLVSPIEEGEVIGTFSKDEYVVNKNNLWARSWNINRGLPAERMHPKNYPDTQKVFRAIKRNAFEEAGGFDEKYGYTDDDSLSERLGIMAQAAPGAIFYHKNPESLKEVFLQSRWMAKRRYKLGPIGYLIALVRTSLPVSLVIGLLKSIWFGTPAFLVFKIISDLGQFIGVLEYMFLGRVAK